MNDADVDVDKMVDQLELIMSNRFEEANPHQRFLAVHRLLHRLAAKVSGVKSVRVIIRYHRDAFQRTGKK